MGPYFIKSLVPISKLAGPYKFSEQCTGRPVIELVSNITDLVDLKFLQIWRESSASGLSSMQDRYMAQIFFCYITTKSGSLKPERSFHDSIMMIAIINRALGK